MGEVIIMIKIRNKILFALIMFFVILIFNSIDVEAAGKYDYLILGDSLTSQMYAAYTGSWNQFVQQSKTINGKEVMFLGAGGYGYDYWFNNHYQDIQKALKNAKDGALAKLQQNSPKLISIFVVILLQQVEQVITKNLIILIKLY